MSTDDGRQQPDRDDCSLLWLANLTASAYNAGMKNAIVLTVDGLNAGFLGPYGNTWIETPFLNRLAVESALFEFAYSDSTQLPVFSRSMWGGLHAMAPSQSVHTIADRLAASDAHSALITDSEELAQLPLGSSFRDPVFIDAPRVEQVADHISETHFARFLTEVAQWLEEASGPFLLCAHSRGMQGPWDAPLEFRNQFADEEDPLPPEFVDPPVVMLSSNEDPDRLLGIQHAYAGQISLLDECLGVFWNACREMPAMKETLLILTAPRGYPLGEHGRVGLADAAMFGEHLHVPCLVRYPDGSHAAGRSHNLIQPTDIFATLRDWFALPDEAASDWGVSLTTRLHGEAESDRVCAVSGNSRAIRTPAWFMFQGENGHSELFAKPGDRWEANEVSSLGQDVTEELTGVMEEFEQAVAASDRTKLSQLSPLLRYGIE